jgi:hypothetical protein
MERLIASSVVERYQAKKNGTRQFNGTSERIRLLSAGRFWPGVYEVLRVFEL